MTIRVTEHTCRRVGGRTCCICHGEVRIGDRYRELTAVQSESFNEPFARRLAHDFCARTEGEWWAVTTPAVLHQRAVDSLSYVRETYKIDVLPQQRCVALGKPGVVIGGCGKYIRVLLDGHRHEANHHVRDVELDYSATSTTSSHIRSHA